MTDFLCICETSRWEGSPATAEAKFLVPDWGIQSTTSPLAYVACRAGTTTLCQSQLYCIPRSWTKNLATALVQSLTVSPSLLICLHINQVVKDTEL